MRNIVWESCPTTNFVFVLSKLFGKKIICYHFLTSLTVIFIDSHDPVLWEIGRQSPDLRMEKPRFPVSIRPVVTIRSVQMGNGTFVGLGGNGDRIESRISSTFQPTPQSSFPTWAATYGLDNQPSWTDSNQRSHPVTTNQSIVINDPKSTSHRFLIDSASFVF